MKIIEIWVTLDELEGARTRRDFIDSSGMKNMKHFIYRQPFGLRFRYRHQVDEHNNRRHAPISLERTWATKLWPDQKFTWYLAVSEVNTALESGHFQNDGVVQPSLNFRRALAIECLENTIGVELGENGRPKRTSKIPIYVPCERITVKHHGGMRDPSKKKEKVKQKYQKQRCQNYSKCGKKTGVYCKCSKDLFLCSGCFADHKVERVTNFKVVTH